MIKVTLCGIPACRRYKKMRETVLVEATRLGIAVRLEEIGDTDSLSRINPLSLPCLYVSDELVASQNPIKVGVTV
jgi:hypothetical protein